jgi:hypothetical protein
VSAERGEIYITVGYPMTFKKGILLLAALPLLTGPGAMAQDPAELDKVVQRIVKQENQFLAILRGHHPIAETYVQELKPDPELESVPASDQYFLGKIDLSKGVTVDSFIPEPKFRVRLLSFKKIFSVVMLPRGFAQMIVVDGDSFNTDTYLFEFVKREFLGDVRTLVFNVAPRPNSGTGRFVGRIWVEDRNFSIVRFNGTYGPKAKGSFFLHFDSWRVNTGPDLWVPAAIYVEEGSFPYAFGMKRLAFKAQTRFWGYDAEQSADGSIFTNLTVDVPDAQDHSEAAADASPLDAARAWQHHAEQNVLARMEHAALLSKPGSVDKVLETVVNNLIITNNLELGSDVHCRILLTSPLESFTVGRTIVISRGLLDTLPDEASLAAVLAHELAHIALGHKLDTKFAFNDRTLFEDTKVIEKLAFARTDEEESAADEKAMDLLAHSPYKDKLAGPGLFLRALAARAANIPNLTHPLFGGRLAKESSVIRMTKLMETAPELQERKLDQVAALPLGGRIWVDPWTDDVRMLRIKSIPLLAAREKMQFEVAPVYINLTREKPAEEPATAAGPAAGTGPGVAAAK